MFDPTDTNCEVTCFDCTHLQSSPTIVVGSLQITHWDAFYARNGNSKDQNRGTRRFCAHLCSQIEYYIMKPPHGEGPSFLYITKHRLICY